MKWKYHIVVDTQIFENNKIWWFVKFMILSMSGMDVCDLSRSVGWCSASTISNPQLSDFIQFFKCKFHCNVILCGANSHFNCVMSF